MIFLVKLTSNGATTHQQLTVVQAETVVAVAKYVTSQLIPLCGFIVDEMTIRTLPESHCRVLYNPIDYPVTLIA